MPKSETSLKELLHEVRRVAKSREVLTEKKIRQIYRSVMQDLNGYLADAYVKYSDDEGRLTLSQLKSKTSYARFLEEVAERVDTLSPALRREMLNLADDVYSRSWRSMTDAVQNAADLKPYRDILGDSLVRPEVMRQAVKNNISKLTLPPLLERNRQDVIYQIQQVLGIGLMNGDRYDTMAKKITERLDVSYSKAVLTARTESHRNQEAGMLDCAKEISSGVEGSGLIYTATWRTMQDERVRPNHRYHTKSGWKTVRSGKADHQKMEGKIIRVGDRFDLGDGVFAEAPGSSGVAAHDCNCRCYLEYALMTPEEFIAAGGKFDEKHFTNTENRDIIFGGISGALDPDDREAEEHAFRYYESVRHMTTDVDRIASNTGFSVDEIQRIKEFVFLTKHDLGDDEPSYFYPSYAMAQSWQRLIDGKSIQPHDITLLRHELLESSFMAQGYSQDAAHRLASKKYNYRKESDEYYDSLKKRKKRK